MKPNLFNYATSELSQDAVLCWLAAWCSPDHAAHDPLLHELGKQFIRAAFVACGAPHPADVFSVRVDRQYRNIDIVVRINETIALCIEDKAGSTEHSGQLDRYLEAMRQEENPPELILPVYIQTYNQNCYQGVEASGYKVFSRRDLISVLASYADAGGTNAIALDFLEHLQSLEAWFESFRTLDPKLWKDAGPWQGFFGELKQHLNKGDWDYVPNPAGGFWAYTWGWKEVGASSIYLQLEEGLLTCRIWPSQDADRRYERDKWSGRFIESANKAGLPFVKPPKFRSGSSMRVAQLADDYRVTDGNGRIDLRATTEVLARTEIVLADAARAYSEAVAAEPTEV